MRVLVGVSGVAELLNGCFGTGDEGDHVDSDVVLFAEFAYFCDLLFVVFKVGGDEGYDSLAAVFVATVLQG